MNLQEAKQFVTNCKTVTEIKTFISNSGLVTNHPVEIARLNVHAYEKAEELGEPIRSTGIKNLYNGFIKIFEAKDEPAREQAVKETEDHLSTLTEDKDYNAAKTMMFATVLMAAQSPYGL